MDNNKSKLLDLSFAPRFNLKILDGIIWEHLVSLLILYSLVFLIFKFKI